MRRLKTYLEGNLRVKWMLNGAYVYLMHLMHAILDLLPGFIRKALFKVLLRRMGANVFIDYRVYIKYPRLLEIGNDVSINRGVEFYAEYFGRHSIVIGNNVRIGPNVRIHAAGHAYDDERFAHTGGDIVVGDNVWIGASAMILQGVTVGAGAVVAAGSVVTKNVPERTLVAGIPAVVKRKL